MGYDVSWHRRKHTELRTTATLFHLLMGLFVVELNTRTRVHDVVHGNDSEKQRTLLLILSHFSLFSDEEFNSELARANNTKLAHIEP